MKKVNGFRLSLVLLLGLMAARASAAFHSIEIEQVVGGLGGNASAMAIQLRLRSANQNQFGGTPVRIRVWDSTGSNPTVIGTISSNFGSGSSGSRILFATQEFTNLTGFSPDFTLAVIPFSYFAGGKITFEQASDGGVLWSVAWGNYSGSNTGLTPGNLGNDTDGNYGPPFGGSLPINGLGLLFKNGTNFSTNNAADYAATSGFATVTKNNGSSIVVPEPGTLGMLAVGGVALGGLVWSRRRAV